MRIRISTCLAGALIVGTIVDAAAVLDGEVPMDRIDAETRCGIGRSRDCDIKVAVGRGMFETGLRPRFPAGLDCRDIDEQWAISYTYKRSRENYHGGIDMPAPYGTPMIAAAAGTVVAVYRGERTPRGMEITLRHAPKETGLPFWIYTQYAHFDEMPTLEPGQRVAMGQKLGPTGNSGIQPGRAKRARRPAIHFAVWYSQSPNFAVGQRKVIPHDSYWMDPNALYRGNPTVDSAALKALPEDQKQVPIPVMLADGTTVPAGTKVVWPYTCSRSGSSDSGEPTTDEGSNEGN